MRASIIAVGLAALSLMPACRQEAASPAPASPSERHDPAPAAGPPAAGTDTPRVAGEVTASHQFYGVYLSGQKAGWAEERVELTEEGGARLSMQVELRIQRMGETMTLKIADRVTYGPLPAGRVTSFEMTETMPGGGSATRKGEVKDGKLHVTIAAAGATSDKVLDVPHETAADTLPALVVPRLKAAEGKPVTTWQFDRQNLRDIPVQTTLLSEKKTMIRGVPTTVLEVRGVDEVRGITMHNRLTAEGRTLEMALGPGLKLVLEDREIAQNPAVVVPDLYRLSVVPVDKPLGEPGGLDYLKVRLSGLPPTLDLTDGRQRREGEVVTVARKAPADLPAADLTDEERARWLEATPFVDHEAAPIRALLANIPAGDDLSRVAAMTRTVHRALSYTLATAPLTASEILKGGKGDCTEYARLMTALARAAGLPAREVSGMAYAGDSDPGFAFHAWVEVYADGRWVAADPTWNQPNPDATHIALSRDDPSSIVGLLGGIEATVLEKR